jgi:uncharacterized repeat protein (TIGR03803 family)
VFKVAPDGTETVLLAFSGGFDGANPQAGLLLDKAGILYGTTEGGGRPGQGTVFAVSPDGRETVLHAFFCPQAETIHACPDGAYPFSQLTSDKFGNLYGTTLQGGSGGGGTVFKLQKKTGNLRVLYNFCSQYECRDGGGPQAGVTIDHAGNLYGTTSAGGLEVNFGVVFKVAPDGTETVLHYFDPGAPNGDGLMPLAGVVLDRVGNLYGTTLQASGTGCKSGDSVAYAISGDGGEKLFCAPPEPTAGLIERNGYLFGTASSGEVFSIRK